MASILSTKQKKKGDYTLEDLKTLGHRLLSSRTHINNLPLLLTFISPSSRVSHVLEALISLQAFFIPVIPALPSSSSKPVVRAGEAEKEDPETVYWTWLRSKFDLFVDALIELVVSDQSDDTVKDVALDAVMEFVKLGKGGRFQSAIYHRLLHNAVHSTSSIDVLLELLASRFFKYLDVRYFTYISLENFGRTFNPVKPSDNRDSRSRDDNKLIARSSEDVAICKIHDILSRIPAFSDQDQKADHEMWSESGISLKKGEPELSSQVVEGVLGEPKKSKDDTQSASSIGRKMKLKFTKAWMSFLKLPLPLDVYKEVLVNLHRAVFPFMRNPVVLCDFLTRSYDIGGVISVMALSGLFVLMTEHGLEYPNFYEKLYALLVPNIFMAKHRAKFFELLDSCLKSPLLPAYLAAAFAKKLSRLSLSVPPSGSLVIIALIHNILRRHPSINFLVHRQTEEESIGDSVGRDEPAKSTSAVSDMVKQKQGFDLFKVEESDPKNSDAMRSSLWEIDTLRHHYCPAVSRFVVSLETDLTVRAKTSEITVKDFTAGSYATIFKSETGRRIKQVPLAFYRTTPTALFSDSDFPGWTFNSQENSGVIKEENGEATNGKEVDHKSVKRQRVEPS